MSFTELLRTALHSLRINPIRSLLAILGVIFGVGAVIVLISMGQGVKAQISDQVRGLGTDLIIVKSGKPVSSEDQQMTAQTVSTVQLPNSNLTNKDTEAVAGQKDLVLGVTGTVEQPNQITAPTPYDIKLVGADGNFRTVRELNYAATASGWTFEKIKPGECVIGYAVLTKEFPNEKPAGALEKKITIGNKEFTVKAVAAKKEQSLVADPNRQVFVGIGDARTINGAGDTDKVLEVYAKVKEASRVKEAKEQITTALKQARGEGAGDFYVATQDDLVASYNKIFAILSALVIGVALVALAESGIGVSNIMYIAVKERTREIGVRLAQGASSRAIWTQFLFESVTLCLVGSAIGIPLGWFVGFLINEFTVLPAQTPYWAILVAFGAGMVVGVAAGVYPAWKATQSDIAEVLRAE